MKQISIGGSIQGIEKLFLVRQKFTIQSNYYAFKAINNNTVLIQQALQQLPMNIKIIFICAKIY